MSFAKKLKQEVSEISKQLYGIDTTNCTRDEKNLIRPLLLAHGAIMREKTDVLAKWMTLEVGKPLAEAAGEVGGLSLIHI